MLILTSFLATVMAGIISNVVAHYFCKWLDRRKSKKQSN